ncbi:MAG: hypothetical protein ACFE9D_11985 [Promethearchaeota archaeon]
MIIKGAPFLLQNLFEQLSLYLITGWDFVLLIGTFSSALLIAIGFIYWFTGANPKKGKNMVFGGIILFVIMQWLAFNPPWLVILG